MDRNQRRYGRFNRKIDDKNDITPKHDIEEVLSPKRRYRSGFDKSVANRSCYVKPSFKDEEQSVDNHSLDIHFKDLIKQQYDFDPLFPDSVKTIKALRKVLCSSQSTNTGPRSFVETSDGSRWQNVDNIDELEKLFIATESIPKAVDSKNIYISEVPRIKVIAEKYSKFSRNNVELRKLEEKIVCIEYDIFENVQLTDKIPDNRDSMKLVQKMRAYFSVKPISKAVNEVNTVTILPSTIKRKYHINEDDLDKLNEKEIEIIDEKIAEHKPYLDELKRVLKKKQAIYAKKKKSSLDLKSLYEMAKRESPGLDEDYSNTNLLSTAELDEIKALITKNCASSIHGIHRHTVKTGELESKGSERPMNIISKSIFAELMRNDARA
ncbi:uncharacterized protein LOC112058075 [Bicyclus anynana]|uniref:Uncharacterized protein LOC112058075 n=1 Tax=Bicyclus anynana TaxID=110368 RepID=A0ABM3LQ30_BICAN|nr:uncharacterized protein LOC112058075 [Bicyclus anynana]